MQQALAADEGLEPPLVGDTSADVAIVGGGFLGLWTAIRLKEHDPSLDVVIV
ncbi:MAG: FAD-dependent oxidoreductase, partial [Proteobacteria bacterium]